MRMVLTRASLRASDLAMALSEIAIALMMLHVVTEIFSRRLFRVSLDSVPEIVSFYYMSAVVFLSLAHVTRADAHIAATLFTDRLPARIQRYLTGTILVVLAVVMLALARQLGVEAYRMTLIGEFHQGASLNLPKWPTRWFPPVGAALMALTALLMALEKFTNSHALSPAPDTGGPADEARERQAV